MLEYLQNNKRSILLFLLGVVFIVSTLFINFIKPHKKEAASSDLVSVLSKNNEQRTGLLDVKEGEELPNWKLAVMEKAKADDPTIAIGGEAVVDMSTLDDPNNITTQYAKNVYAATAILEQQNGPLTDEQKESLARAFFEEEASKITSKRYEMKDIVTVPATKTTIKTYGNALGGIVTNAIIKMAETEDVPTFEKYVQYNSPEDLLAINTKINTVTKFRDDILKLNTPKSAVLLHLSLANAIEAYRQTLINMKAVHTDALRATISSRDYAHVVRTLYVTIDFFSQYFEQEGVVFKPNENGAFFDGFLLTPKTP